MAKRPIWREKIVDVLQDKSLNYSELYNAVEIEVKKEIKDIGDRALKKFNGPLMKLLNEDKILVIGYDKSVGPKKRVQSFHLDGLIFTLVKTDPLEIYPLIAGLNDSNIDNVKKSYYELINIFRKKIGDYETLQLEKCESLKSNVEIKPLKEFYNEYKDRQIKVTSNGFNKFIDENYIEILDNAKVTHETDKSKFEFISLERIENCTRKILKSKAFEGYSEHNKQLFNERKIRRYSIITRLFLCKKIIPEILNKYENAKIMRFSGFNIELPKIRFEPQSYVHAPYMLSGIIDLKGNITPSDFLSLFKIKKPERMSKDYINSIFYPIIFEIFVKKDNEFLKFGLANALSDSEESLRWLEYFILEVGFKFSIREDELLSKLEGGPDIIRISDPWK